MKDVIDSDELLERRLRLHRMVAECNEEKIKALVHLLTELSKSQALLIAVERALEESQAS